MSEKSIVIIKEVHSKDEIKEFAFFPYDFYSGDPNWVPPIKSDYLSYVIGKGNYLNQAGPNVKIIALREEVVVVGRLLVGINEEINREKNLKDGYISLFESVNDTDVSNKMLSFAVDWLKDKGITCVKGPLSLPGGDDNRGFLIDNFKDHTMIMNTYNKPWYPDLFEAFGFEKYHDVYAYISDSDNENIKRYEKMVPYAMKRYHFTVDRIDLKNIDTEMADVKKIIEEAMPWEWEDFLPPNEEETKIIAKQLVPFADPDLIYIARNLEGRPIGFNIALPDYNEVLSKLNGKLLPTGIFKFLYHKKRIKGLRFFVLFVIPEYRNKGVSSAIYYHIFNAAVKKGYTHVEGSTIWDYNEEMKLDIEKYGGRLYKTYRVFSKQI
ncbi:MAG: GNAT family N-acetyltransferase [Gudongella sp.]|nr:GNAT family N-acetyltransferase [Gudongella sp.]